jgi:hypothetical protein
MEDLDFTDVVVGVDAAADFAAGLLEGGELDAGRIDLRLALLIVEECLFTADVKLESLVLGRRRTPGRAVLAVVCFALTRLDATVFGEAGEPFRSTLEHFDASVIVDEERRMARSAREAPRAFISTVSFSARASLLI